MVKIFKEKSKCDICGEIVFQKELSKVLLSTHSKSMPTKTKFEMASIIICSNCKDKLRGKFKYA